MKIIKAKTRSDIPKIYSGLVVWEDGDKWWYKEGKHHREDGPAVEWKDGTKLWYKEGEIHREDGPACEYVGGAKRWFLEKKEYREINLQDYVILDEYKGKYGLIWYKLLSKDKIIECPDIPGLITK